MSRRRDEEFRPHFEGRQILDGLLALAGSEVDSEEVLARLQEAHAAGEEHTDVIPTLFEGEPHFPNPEVAKRLFQNLVGLWELVEEGRTVQLDVGEKEPRPKKPRPPPAPAPFAPGEPDDAFVEAAWRHLEGDEKARARHLHAFENRQDALLGALDEAGLSDEGYGVARHLLFELHAMLELGWPAGLASVSPREVVGAAPQAPPVPQPLSDYAAEALFEVEQDEEHPLRGEELARVRTLVERGLAALWRARKGSGGTHGT